MKKTLLIILFGCLGTSLFAQTPSLKPTQGDIGFTVGISGIDNTGFNFGVGHAGTLLFRYYLNNSWAIRGQFNLMTSSNTQSYSDTIASYSNSVKSSQWSIGLGIQKSFAATARLEPYLAFEIYLGSGKFGTGDSTATGVGTNAGNSYSAVLTPGSTFTFGAGFVLGFNYFITDHVALGGEFNFGYANSNTGDGTRVVTFTSKSGTVTTTTTTTNNIYGNTLSGIAPNASGTITLSIFFPAKW